VRFVQTVGGRMGIPTPRPVRRRPFVQFWPSIAWSTLELVINADGTSTRRLAGASPFPRHWVYDEAGKLVEQSAVIDFKAWADHCFGDGTPWGSYDSERLTSAAESALERELSGTILRGGRKPKVRVLDEGAVLTTQGEEATDVYVVIDGQFDVSIDGESVAEIGPGAVVGERAALEHGVRTATLRALTRARVAEIAPDELDARKLEGLASTR
jgi:hypothetical protein